ncbi:hypothetical protein QSH16_17360 [Proteus faecis]|nr:hypothetical protein [Proteus faecis]MDL5349674.1 hypothetical protein [Proteus faecis]
MEKYFKLTDTASYGEIIKVCISEGKPPRSFSFDKKNNVWQPTVGFFSEYTIPEDGSNYGMYEELTESEAQNYITDFVETAHELAKKYHDGQTDKAGVAYINHPEYVASLVTTDEEKATAYLHDTLEDTSLTVEQLKNAKIPTAVIDAVSVLTKNRNEDYFSYLEKVKHNPIARKVKLADLQHNSDLTRLNHLEKKDMDRLVKYKKAQLFLTENE